MSTNLFTMAQGAAEKKDDAVESVSSFWNDENVQLWLIERPIRIGLIIILAFIAHWALRHLINRLAKNSIKASTLKKPSRTRSRSGEGGDGQPDDTLRETREARRASRIKTLAGVGRSAGQR